MKLIIGNQNYSSWSLRPWLLLKYFNIPFDTEVFWLAVEGRREKLLEYSPSCKVPVLIDAETHIWDTLAICEYINEKFLAGKAWPANLQARAHARAITCEMHSGLFALRNELPMNCRARRKITFTAETLAEIARVEAIFSAAEGPWLFADFSIADCFFAPVALRFKIYNVPLSQAASDYCERLLEHPAMQLWLQQALRETEVIEEYEIGEAF